MDKRDLLIGFLASALVGTPILWGLSGNRGQSAAPPYVRAPVLPPPAPPPAVRPVPRWSPETESPPESFRYRPLGERERARLGWPPRPAVGEQPLRDSWDRGYEPAPDPRTPPVPQWRGVPPDAAPPSRGMYPSLDQPTVGPPADRPLVAGSADPRHAAKTATRETSRSDRRPG